MSLLNSLNLSNHHNPQTVWQEYLPNLFNMADCLRLNLYKKHLYKF